MEHTTASTTASTEVSILEAATDQNLICPICCDSFVNPVILTKCSHMFCQNCIYTHHGFANPKCVCGSCGTKCPCCRKTFSTEEIIPVRNLDNFLQSIHTNDSEYSDRLNESAKSDMERNKQKEKHEADIEIIKAFFKITMEETQKKLERDQEEARLVLEEKTRKLRETEKKLRHEQQKLKNMKRKRLAKKRLAKKQLEKKQLEKKSFAQALAAKMNTKKSKKTAKKIAKKINKKKPRSTFAKALSSGLSSGGL